MHGAPDPRRIKLPPGGACVDVTPNLVWIAQVGDRVQVRHDLGHVRAHEAEDVVTEVGTRPRKNGFLMAGSGGGRHVHVIVAEIGAAPIRPAVGIEGIGLQVVERLNAGTAGPVVTE